MLRCCYSSLIKPSTILPQLQAFRACRLGLAFSSGSNRKRTLNTRDKHLFIDRGGRKSLKHKTKPASDKGKLVSSTTPDEETNMDSIRRKLATMEESPAREKGRKSRKKELDQAKPDNQGSMEVRMADGTTKSSPSLESQFEPGEVSFSL